MLHEEVLLLHEEGLAVCLSLRLRLLLAGLLLPVLLLNGLSAYHILLSCVDRHLEPLEELAKACVVSINFLLSERLDDLLTVVDPVVGLELALLLTPDFVIGHLKWQPINDERLGFLPTEFVRVGFADTLSLATVDEEERLKDVWHLQDPECLDVVQDLFVLFSIYEPFGFSLKSLLVVVDLLEDRIISNHLRLEVVSIELQGVVGISKSLGFLSLGTFFDLDAHEFELAITVGSQTILLLLLPALPVGRDGLQDEPLLVI